MTISRVRGTLRLFPEREGVFMSSLWERLKSALKEKLPEASYKVWIEPIHCLGFFENTLILGCPNHFSLTWIKENYFSIIEEIIRKQNLSIKVKLIAEETPPPKIIQRDLPYDPTRLIGRRLSPRYTFEEFVVGECNRLAYATCWSLATEKQQGNIVYLYADTGLGKSHLSQAVGNYLLSNPGKERICYLTAQDFTTQVVKALKNDRLDEFKQKLRGGCEILMLEEVHFFAGKEFTQAELALTLDYLYDAGKTVVLTADRPPQKIPKLDPSLRSRLSAGVLIRINPPDYKTRVNIIKRKAKNQGFEFPEEVVTFLAKHLRGDIRQIESAVIGLVARSSFLRQSIDLSLAKELIQEILPEEPQITKEFILDLVCHHFRITKEELCSKSRERRVTFPRQVAMYLCRKFTGESLQAIGKLFNRDHATVIYAISKVEKALSRPGSVKYQIEYLYREIEERLQASITKGPEKA